MNAQLPFTMFHEVFFPTSMGATKSETVEDLTLSKMIRIVIDKSSSFRDHSWCVFDFETTGLDAREDAIIEIGAIKFLRGQEVARYSTLIDPERSMADHISAISGITNDMLIGQPKLNQALPQFLQFLSGSILCAHNAEFDWQFLTTHAARLGFELQLPCFCTLKLARQFLPQLESKNLDSLAQHYQLQFAARHRSIGDAEVTATVLENILAHEARDLRTWGQLFEVAGVV